MTIVDILMTPVERTRLGVLEETIERGMRTFVEVGQALAEIRDGLLYRDTHNRFEDYCQERFDLSRPSAYRLIDAAAVTDVLSPIGDTLPKTESVARELAPLSPANGLVYFVVEGSPTGKAGLCECGCGQPAPLAGKTSSKRGAVKGQPLRFISGHNQRGSRRIESPEQRLARFWSKVDRRGPDECWPWTAGCFRGGYGQFKSNGQTYVASRLALETATGKPIPAGMFACHHCDNPRCCNPAHLFVGDAAANNADMVAKGRLRAPRRGDGSGRKLTWEQVEEIRRRYGAGSISQRALATEYGVWQMTISRIVRGAAW